MGDPANISPVRRWAVPGLVLACLAAAALASLLVPAIRSEVGFVGMVLGYLTAGTLILVRSRRLEARERSAWRTLAVGVFLVASGVIVVGVLTELGFDLPAFGPLDIFFLAGYAMLLVTFYKLARGDKEGADWLLTLLDALVGGIALSALVWTAFFHELVESFRGAPTWEALISITYPVLDIAAVIGLMILVIRRSHFRMDPRLVFLAIGLGVQVFADLIFLYTGVGRSFAEAEPNFLLLMVAAAAYLTAATVVDRVPAKREFPDREAPFIAYIWPYLLACALLITHVIRYRTLNPTGDETLLLDALLAIGGVVFLRQMVMIHRNRIRVENQRSDLVASVSHELRTPLTAMVGYLTLLDQEGDEFPEEARREMLSEATNQAKHIARLVSDLVMLARRDHRSLPLEISEGHLSAIVVGALRGIDPGNSMIEERFEEDPLVRVDLDRLRQAVSNLISNAVRYGGERVLVTGHVEDVDLVLEVHDDGPGVPTRHEETIWERFERGAHRLNATTPGMGIGLAIVLAIANAHGGKAMYRRSEELGGACFTITIPGCVVERETAAARA